MRSATEWRDRGERELAELLAAAWTPARPGDATATIAAWFEAA